MIVEKYGEPDAVLVSSIWVNWNKEPETSMALFYDNIDASIILGEQQGNKFSVAPTTPIEAIGYSDHTFPTISEYESGVRFLSSWHGYGEYLDVPRP